MEKKTQKKFSGVFGNLVEKEMPIYEKLPFVDQKKKVLELITNKYETCGQEAECLEMTKMKEEVEKITNPTRLLKYVYDYYLAFTGHKVIR